MAANPPDGAVVDYYLSSAASTLTLEILDAKGQLVRSFSNSDKPEITEEDLKETIDPVVLGSWPAASLDRAGHAPLDLGPSRSCACKHAP